MNPIMNLMGSLVSKGKYVLGGGLGFFGASQLVTQIQDTASAVAEKAVEIQSGAQAQNGNIDNFFAGFNRTQGIMGFVAGIAMWIGQLTGNQGMINWAEKQMKNSRDAQESIQGDIRERSKEAVQGLPGSVAGLTAGGLGAAVGIGALSLGGSAVNAVKSAFGFGNGPSGPTGGGGGTPSLGTAGPSALSSADDGMKAMQDAQLGKGVAAAAEEGVEAAAKKPGLMSRAFAGLKGVLGGRAAAALAVGTVATTVASSVFADESPAEAPTASGSTPTVREVEAGMKSEGYFNAAIKGLNHGANAAVSTVAGTPHWLGEKMGIDMPEAINGRNISTYFNELTDRVAPAAMFKNAINGYEKGGFSGAFENVVNPAETVRTAAEERVYEASKIAGNVAAGLVMSGGVGSFAGAALGGGRVAATAAPIAADVAVPTVVMGHNMH